VGQMLILKQNGLGVPPKLGLAFISLCVRFCLHWLSSNALSLQVVWNLFKITEDHRKIG
jgi:hypothetical protein